MRIGRRSSIIISIAIMAIFFGTGLILLNTRDTHLPLANKTVYPTTPHPLVTPNPSIAAINTAVGDTGAGLFTINKFHRSESKDGKLKWEIFGDSASLQGARGGILIKDAVLSIFDNDSKSSKLSTAEAFVVIDGSSLSSAELRGDTVATYSDGTTAKSQHAVYDRIKDVITSDQPVTIENEKISISSNRFTGEITKEIFRFEGDVRTEIKARGKKK